MSKMNGLKVLITGGSMGIGAAFVKKAVARGSQVIVADMVEPVEPIPGVTFIKTDVGSSASLRSCFDEAHDIFKGSMDCLINNAGIGEKKRFFKVSSYIPTL